MKSWDAIVIGAGIIGLSLALELRKSGASVLIADKGEPGREASWAAGGMLADFFLETPPLLHELAAASARMYLDFVQQLEADSGMKIDLRAEGTIVFLQTDHEPSLLQTYPLPAPLSELEPALTPPRAPVLFLDERSVDPRHLIAASLAAARHCGVDFAWNDPVYAVEIENGNTAGVHTATTQLFAPVVVNCAGAWSSQISAGTGKSVGTGVSPVPALLRNSRTRMFSTTPGPLPTRPVKGQMLSVAMPQKEFVRHVIRAADVYLIPRSDGHLVIGATLEEAGFDKQTVPETIHKLRQSAISHVPKLADAPIHETWAGLRPGTPDKLPILGETSTPGYFVATGHFRDGILLAPVTARVMAQRISGHKPTFDLSAFSPRRFQ